MTIGSIHGGTQANVIPDEVKLELNIRTYTDEVQKRVLAAVDAHREGGGVGIGRATRAVDHDARVGPRRRERSCVDEASGRGAAEGDGHAAGQSRCRRR